MITTSVFSKNIRAYKEGKTIIINQGGSSSSKTWSELQLLTLINQKYKLHSSVVSESMPHLKKGAMKDLISILDIDTIPHQRNKTDSIFTFGDKGLIEFFSADQSDKVRGPRRDLLYINECNFISWETFYQLYSRTKLCTFLDFNPTQRFWVHDKLIPMLEKEQFEFIKSTYRDNDQLSANERRAIEQRALNDENYRTVYADGEIGNLEGLIFTNWAITDDLPETDKRIIGIDFGFTNDPTVITDLRLNNGELWAHTVIYQTGLLNNDIARIINGAGIPQSITKICDGAEAKSIAELEAFGIKNCVAATKGAGSVNAGIDRLKQYKINITRSSVEAIKEARNYQWKKDKNGNTLNKPQDFNNHFWDSIRYASEGLLNLKAKKAARYIFD